MTSGDVGGRTRSPRVQVPLSVKVIIGTLAAATSLVIILLFGGTADHRYARVLCSVVVFVAFMLLLSFDQQEQQRSGRYYLVIAIVLDLYVLLVSLGVIWQKAVADRGRVIDMIPAVAFLAVCALLFGVTRAALLGVRFLQRSLRHEQRPLPALFLTASCLLAGSAALFALPGLLWAAGRPTPEAFWQVAVALLLVTASVSAVASLLHWSVDRQVRTRTLVETADAIFPASPSSPTAHIDEHLDSPYAAWGSPATPPRVDDEDTVPLGQPRH